MFDFFGIKIGRYILFNKSIYTKCCYKPIDKNVKIISDVKQLKNNRLGIGEGDWERLVQNNSELFAYFDGDILQGMMWGHRGSCYIRGPGISLLQDNDIVYCFWIFTLPEARGMNVYNTLRNAFITHYRDAKAFTLLVEPGNKIMRMEMNKMGFVIAKQYLYVKWVNISLLVDKCYKTKKIAIRVGHGNEHKLLVI